MKNRTDTHRPSAIVPDDYEYVACECVKIEGLGDCLFIQQQRETIRAHMANTGGTYSRHEHGGNCHICGSVNLVYSILYYHEASNSYIRCGEDCAAKLDFGGQAEFNRFRAAVHDAREAQAGKKKAMALLDAINLTDAWHVYEATDRTGYQWEENTISDIVGKLVKYGNLSDRQESFIRSLFVKIDRRATIAAQRASEAAAAADCPSGRVKVTGTILSTKVQDSMFGSVCKMLVRDDSGFKVWVTCPGGSKGDRVTFFAQLEPSKDDAKFGFGKRPTKFSVLESAAAPDPAPRDEVNVPDVASNRDNYYR